ncbi:hypothetical protein [Flavobacterium sp. MK4S-17]|uniref:hypothetical protein n=1 Tax=Flavobacterium sp. MK4S-17 TaxID=2543737 RepID=UPI001357FABE|nr:hypothetical protein [Flavobacterium sp. MK4S-17]
MRKILQFILLIPIIVDAQVPFQNYTTSNGSAERIAGFGVTQTPNDFLEITNSTQDDNIFIPSIWGHQESDNRFVLRLFASTIASLDNGNSPIMVFRSELRNSINLNAPQGTVFPWGNSAADVSVRPVFAWENGNTRLMTISANGNLGLGTTLPTALFHTIGTVRLQNLPNNTNPSFMLGTDINGNVYEYPIPTSGTGNTQDIDWLKSDNSVATSINDNIYTNGFVGFNIQNPTANIHSNGSIRFQNLQRSTNPLNLLGTDVDGNVFEYPIPVVAASDSDWLKVDGNQAININDEIYTNGKVGINTNVFPSHVGTEDVSFYNLFVTGGILTEEVRVSKVEDWADYVFRENYDLATLAEVEKYIQQNGHLKNIPSEKEVKANGINLLDMNRLLLEKIEELTLHLIELNKKLENQQREIDKLIGVRR